MATLFIMIAGGDDMTPDFIIGICTGVIITCIVFLFFVRKD